MRIAFIWQGFDGRYGQWKDGLWAAMKLIEQKHTVRYFDTSRIIDVDEFNPDVVLYWEAPITLNGKDRDAYRAVLSLPYKKALLFAGGPVRADICHGFDLYFVESRINEEEFGAIGLPWKRAFGVNTDIFKPQKQPKVFDGAFQATCASWKRHWLGAEALGSKYVVMGRYQESDPIGFMRVREAGGLVLPELSAEAVASVVNASHTVINTSDFWGGGQRSTLEAMACDVPVIVMNDSPKNREYVEESGAGLVIDPDPNKIRNAVEPAKVITGGVEYVQSKWTHHHYANAIIDGISSL